MLKAKGFLRRQQEYFEGSKLCCYLELYFDIVLSYPHYFELLNWFWTMRSYDFQQLNLWICFLKIYKILKGILNLPNKIHKPSPKMLLRVLPPYSPLLFLELDPMISFRSRSNQSSQPYNRYKSIWVAEYQTFSVSSNIVFSM